jgi:hypothetical protein
MINTALEASKVIDLSCQLNEYTGSKKLMLSDCSTMILVITLLDWLLQSLCQQ